MTKSAKLTAGKGATPMKPEKKLRKWFVYNFNRRINEMKKGGKG